MKRPGIEWLLLGVAAAFTLLFVPKLFLGGTALYTELITERVGLAFGAPAKVLLLSLAAVYGFRSAMALGRDNPASRPWWILAAGVALFAVAQSILGFYQVVLGERAPFPSPADPLFMLGTILMAVAAVTFVFVTIRSGLAMGSARDIGLTVGVAALPLAVIGAVVLVPIATAEAPWVEQLLNLGYPTLDLILMVPAFVLLRLMLRMRGGQLWLVWARLLAGVFFMALGDILFAYFTTLGFTAVDPLLDLTFAYAYILLAWGSHTQYVLVRS